MATDSHLRCARCAIVVLDVFPKIMQDILVEAEQTPTSLYKMINNDKYFKGGLNESERAQLDTLLEKGFKYLDTTLVCKIVKRFSLIKRPIKNWKSYPKSTETNVGDDVKRIRLERNALAHRADANVSVESFEKFFDEFIDVGKRMDEYLKLSPASTYETMITTFKTCDLDEERANHYLAALKRIEELEEKLRMTVENKEVIIYAGKSIENIRRHINDKGVSSLQIIIYDVEDIVEQIRILNSLKDKLSSNNITFKYAGKGSIILHFEIENVVLTNEELFRTEMSIFVEQIFVTCRLKTNADEWSFVLTPEKDEAGFKPSDLMERRAMKNEPSSLGGGNSLTLSVDVKNKVLNTQEKFPSTLKDFLENVFKQLTDKNEIKAVVICEDHQVKVTTEKAENRVEKTFPIYTKGENQTGLVLIMNCFSDGTREQLKTESNRDVDNLYHFFSALKYSVHKRCETETDNLAKNLEEFKNDYLVKSADKFHCVFVIVFSHERKERASDFDLLISDVTSPFKNVGSFYGKPIVFLIVSCQEVDELSKWEGIPETYWDFQWKFLLDYMFQKRFSGTDDFFLIYARTGYKSLFGGSHFIDAFLDVAKKYHNEQNLVEIFGHVQDELTTKKKDTKGHVKFWISPNRSKKSIYL